MPSLVSAEDSFLAVIDAQEGFLARLELNRQTPLVERITWLTAVARELGIPVVVTVETPDEMGGLLESIAAELGPRTEQLVKPVFGLYGDEAIRSAVDVTGRRTAVLCGMETDVCVAHSALGLLGAGYRVAVVQDAVQSPGDSHAFGLQRMGNAGAELVSTKGVFYEWVRTVAKARACRQSLAHVPLPEGLVV